MSQMGKECAMLLGCLPCDMKPCDRSSCRRVDYHVLHN